MVTHLSGLTFFFPDGSGTYILHCCHPSLSSLPSTASTGAPRTLLDHMELVKQAEEHLIHLLNQVLLPSDITTPLPLIAADPPMSSGDRGLLHRARRLSFSQFSHLLCRAPTSNASAASLPPCAGQPLGWAVTINQASQAGSTIGLPDGPRP
jgi:hypothetical protein